MKGSTWSSAERASAVLARRRSWLSGASPVQPSHASGCCGRNFATSPAVVARSAGRRLSTGLPPPSSPTMIRNPPCSPWKSGSSLSSAEIVPATPGTFSTAATIVSRISLPPGWPNAGSPSPTRMTRLVKGERKRSWRSFSTACAWPPGMCAATSSRSSSFRAAGTKTAATTTQIATIGQRQRTTPAGQRASLAASEPQAPGFTGSFATRLSTRGRSWHDPGAQEVATRIARATASYPPFMNRRKFLKRVAALPALPALSPLLNRLFPTVSGAALPPLRRVRPTDPGWPRAAAWEELKRAVGGRLIPVQSPLASCLDAPDSAACAARFAEIQNPYFLAEQPGGTQLSGWLDAWTPAPSVYAVAAKSAEDVAAAVDFAREHRLRLVVKGTGHSYLGTSNAPDSLLVWTHGMNAISVQDAFVPKGCGVAARPAVTVDAGVRWVEAYDAVTTKAGRYVQGGGCCTVGVGGLVQGGGFGSFSKNFGLAAAGLLEAEVVTADGKVRVANACTNPDLFWALKGGGGGTFGVVTRMTLATHELPRVRRRRRGQDPGEVRRSVSPSHRRVPALLREEPLQSALGRAGALRQGQHALDPDGLPRPDE